jgi:hypothetical protein
MMISLPSLSTNVGTFEIDKLFFSQVNVSQTFCVNSQAQLATYWLKILVERRFGPLILSIYDD